MPTVVIDFGHGGRDVGAVGKITYEKNNNLILGLKVGNLLSNHGINVEYTRNNDIDFCDDAFSVNSDLFNRMVVAKQYNPDVFISLHNNSGGGKGLETYCYKLGGADEQLAGNIQKSMVEMLGMVDRGVKTANYYMIRKFDLTPTSACLVEYGFIDTEENLILANMDIASVAITKGILSFLGIEYSNQGGIYKVKNIVLVNHGVDERCAGYLADYLNCSIAFKDAIFKSDLDQFENVFEVGGSKTYSRSNHLSGEDRYNTCQKVLDYISNN